MSTVEYRDAIFAYVETSCSPQTLMSAYAFEASGRPASDLVRWIADRAASLAPLRQRMVRPFGDIGLPIWSDDPQFTPDRHIRVHTAEDWAELCVLLPTIHAEPFDWAKPLWEVHLIQGVRGVDGRDDPSDVAVVKMHHSVADGMGATEIARALFSSDIAAECTPTGSTSRFATMAKAVAMLPVTLGRLPVDLLRFVRAQKQVRAEEAEGLWKSPPPQLPRTSINRKLGPDRVVDTVFSSVTELRSAAHRMGDVTVNDLVLTVIGGALATYLGDIEGPIVASVPVSTRDVLDAGTRNRFTTAYVDLHAGIEDPVARADAVHRAVRTDRDRKLSPANVRAEVSAPRLPGFVVRTAVRVFEALPKTSSTITGAHVLVTNVPMGPADGWQLCGSPVFANFGMSTLVDPGGVAHRISSIGDRLAVSVTADPSQMRDLPAYLELIRRGCAELVAHTE
ncbi:wax ester/triacylglycerol synthase domain-containing protein [Prescottella sp. R16]|uniref:wax ester/triacylglycerol synthase domain-containing protein n=1 Tax=Prescottella sp. R16 TaxID=3064529 RepID=UPI00272E9FAE|nr:wax ester/triacylglycerol synthase domain-containing protein [Prescottella sp. R16]